MIQRVLDNLAADPRSFDLLRGILDFGYRGIKRELRRHLQPTPRTLDLGCGTGVLATCFRPAAYLGVDRNGPYLAHARKKHPSHRFARMDGARLAVPDGAMEQVIVVGVLHHCPDDLGRAILAEARRVLRSRGRLLLLEDVPARDWYNLPGHLIHAMDQGDHIRPMVDYEALFAGLFQVLRRISLRSGVCDYAGWLLA